MKDSWNSGCMHTLREAASSWARMEVGDRLKSLASARAHLPEYEYTTRKKQILHRIKRLCPGNTGSLNLLARKVGDDPTNDSTEMAGLLKEHWADTFSKKQVKFKDLDTWWSEDPYTSPSSHKPTPEAPVDPAWTLTVDHVEKAI
eukprot:13957794-Heterocapsa_arctica.AAC.1